MDTELLVGMPADGAQLQGSPPIEKERVGVVHVNVQTGRLQILQKRWEDRNGSVMITKDLANSKDVS